MHLHGVWDHPDTVVFAASDYGEVVSDDAHRAFMSTLWIDRTVLFIGCSFEGMRDPDFAALLDWAAETFPHVTTRHYALVRDNDYSAEQARSFLNRWRIQLLPYGPRHEDLVPFLQSLAPLQPAVAPLPPRTFTGRQAITDEVNGHLATGESVLLQGMGGIGKTSIAAEVVSAMQAGGAGDRIIRLDAARHTLPEIFRRLGRTLKVPGVDFMPDAEVPSSVSLALSGFPGSTIVVDGATDTEVVRALSEYLAQDNVGLIVTARNRAAGFARYVEVPPLEPADAEELFREVAGAPQDDPQVAAICSLLEGHPLAIVLAAGRHAVEDMPLDRLLARLTDEIDRLNALRDPERPESPTTSVRASLLVSLEGLSTDLERTLGALAHFDADVSLHLLAGALQVAPTECEDRLGQLIARSLVQRTPRGPFRLHSLTRSAVRECVKRERSAYLVMVEAGNGSLLNDMDVSPVRAERDFLENLDNVASFIRATATAGREQRRLLAVRLAIMLCEPHGLFHRYGLTTQYLTVAEEMLKAALELAESDENHLLVARVLYCQAHISLSRGEFVGAIDILGRAIEIGVSSLEDRGLLASMRCQIGNSLIELNRFPEAESAMREGLADATAAAHAPAIAQLTGQLGQALLKSGELDAAETQYITARQKYQDLNDLIGVSACAYHLSEIALLRGDVERAWSLQLESLDADIAGNNFSGALTSLERLTSTVGNEDQLTTVLDRVEALSNLLPHAMVSAHPAIVESLKSNAYFHAGQYDRAQELLLTGLTLREDSGDVLGQAVLLGRLSNIALQRSDFAAALEYNQRSRVAYEAAGRPAGVVTCCLNGIVIAVNLDDTSAAVEYGCDAVKVAALQGDLVSVVYTCELLATLVVPRLSEPPEFVFLDGEFSYAEYMGLIASAADARDLARIGGSTRQMLQHFGPGGTPPIQGP